MKKSVKLGIKILLTLLVIVIIWEGFFVLPNPTRLPNPLWQVSSSLEPDGARVWAIHRLLDAGENVSVKYPAMERVLTMAATLPGVGWEGMRDREVASKLACAWVGRGHFKELVDCRPAFLSPAGTRVEWEVDVPSGASLLTAATLLALPGEDMGEPVEFRISFRSGGLGSMVLFDSVLVAEDPTSYPRSWWHRVFGKYLKVEAIADRQTWVEVEVDLPAGVSGPGVFSFETEGVSSEAFPFWSEPRVLSSTAPSNDDLPDIVFFLVDAVQARLLEDEGVNRQVAPNLTMLKESGVYFGNAITNGNWTRPSMYSMFASRPHAELGTPIVAYSIAPVEREVYYRNVRRNLISELKQAGYTAVGMGNNAFLHSATWLGMDMGFDRMWDVERDYYDTIDVTEMAIRYLMRNPREAMVLFVNYNAPHYSYKPPPRYSRKVYGKDHGDLRFLYNQYLGEVRYVDEYLGRVVRALDMLERRDNTLIVACADHGEVTRRHPVIRECADLVSGGTKMVYQHGRSFFDDELRVPLIMSWSGKLPQRREVVDQVQLMDVAPTILDLTVGGIPEEFEGHSLVPLIEGEGEGSPVVFSESRNGIAMRVENRWKYARRFPGFEAVWLTTPDGVRVRDLPEELYNLRADPLEVRNLAGSGHPKLRELRQLFDGGVPGPIWVYRAVLPDSGLVEGEISLSEAPLVVGKVGEVSYTLEGATIRFSGSRNGGGEVYWVPHPSAERSGVQELVLNGAPVVWGPFALSTEGVDFAEWAGMVPSEILPVRGTVWIEKNALEMWVAAGTGRQPLVGGVREILQDWGYIQ